MELSPFQVKALIEKWDKQSSKIKYLYLALQRNKTPQLQLRNGGLVIGSWTPHYKGLNHLKSFKLATIQVFTKSTAEDSDAILLRRCTIEYASSTIEIY
jgi:hypothetical protein